MNVNKIKTGNCYFCEVQFSQKQLEKFYPRGHDFGDYFYVCKRPSCKQNRIPKKIVRRKKLKARVI